MEYLKKKSNQSGRPHKSGKRPKPDRRWTLLFIGNHGRTITLKRFKGMVLLVFFMLMVAIGVSAGLFVWNQKIIMEKHDLEADLKKLDQRIDTLRHEKDILMTRLVLAESRVQQSIGGKPEKTSENKSADQKKSSSDNEDQTIQLAAKKTESPEPNQIKPKPDSEPHDSELSVAIEDFKISNRSDDNRIRVQFKIKNTSLNSQRVSGHTIVVLKGEQTNWLPIPWMPLVDGRPTGKQRGHSFGINYFKTMRLSTGSPKFPEKYQTASVYVFTRKGQLLLEKGYAVKMPPNKPQASKPSPTLHPAPTEPTPPAPGHPTDTPDTSQPSSEELFLETDPVLQ
jgi:hypothetical protein